MTGVAQPGTRVMGTKQAKHSRVELLTSSIHRTAVTSKRYLPQNYVSRIVVANPFSMRCCGTTSCMKASCMKNDDAD
jgi:hypothetical protein